MVFRSKLIPSLLLSLCLFGIPSNCASEDQLVTKLPDLPELAFKFYSGYLDLPDTDFRIHYTIEESLNDPSEDPVIMWFNGGPGCSSMIGQFTELGYFTVSGQEDKWVPNPDSWNHFATVVYIESPPGVGFSYRTKHPQKLAFNDYSSAMVNIELSTVFFEQYPQYAKNDLYVAGESYAGIYVPYLAYLMDQYNSTVAYDDEFKFNLKGFMVGNGVTDFSIDNYSAVDYFKGHALLSPSFEARAREHNCTIMGPLKKGQALTRGSTVTIEGANPYCRKLETEMYKALQHFDLYNLVTDCSAPGVSCPNYGILGPYLNREDVREALHLEDFKGDWEECSNAVSSSYEWNLPGSISIYPQMIQKGYKILKYSGDADSMVPFNGSMEWITNLNLEIIENWRQWFLRGGEYPNEPAGFVQVYDGLTFATVRNAGHMVPQLKGAELYHLVHSFIFDESI